MDSCGELVLIFSKKTAEETSISIRTLIGCKLMQQLDLNAV